MYGERRLQVHNPSCTAIAEVKFPADYLEYTCNSVTVGIHIKIFLGILKILKQFTIENAGLILSIKMLIQHKDDINGSCLNVRTK